MIRIFLAWVISVAVALTLGVWLGKTFESKMVVKVVHIADASPSGGPEWVPLVKGKHIPPRCREVPRGYGCIDWRDVGESAESYAKVLQSRGLSGDGQ